MPLNPLSVKKILVITLSNIGDVVLTFPTIDILRNDFPQAAITVIVGPKAESLLKNNPSFRRVIVFDKHDTASNKMRLAFALRQERFDLIVDLRNSAMPIFLGAKHRTSFKMNAESTLHMRNKHLLHLQSVYDYRHSEAKPKNLDLSPAAQDDKPKKYSLYLSGEDEHYILESLGEIKKFVVIAAGSADSAKRWAPEKFAALTDKIIETFKVKAVFVGDRDDQLITDKIRSLMNNLTLNLSGKTTLTQMAQLIDTSIGVVANDSAPAHIASYLDKPVVAIFGKGDPSRYGPWGKQGKFVQGKNSLIANVSVEEVFSAFESVVHRA